MEEEEQRPVDRAEAQEPRKWEIWDESAEMTRAQFDRMAEVMDRLRPSLDRFHGAVLSVEKSVVKIGGDYKAAAEEMRRLRMGGL